MDYVLSTASEVGRNRRKIRRARNEGVPIMTELFVHRLINAGDSFDMTPYILIEGVKVSFFLKDECVLEV